MKYYHLSELVFRRAEQYKDRIAVEFQSLRSSEWKKITWRTLAQEVMKTAKAMAHFGIKEQQNIGVCSQNMSKYFISDLAGYANRAVMVPIYATSSPSQIEYIVTDTQMEVMFVGEQLQYDNAFEVMKKSATLKQLIIFDQRIALHPEDKNTIYFEDFQRLGDTPEMEALVKSRIEAAKPEDLAMLIYTSGTTGEPKGAMLLHSCLEAILHMYDERLTMFTEKERSVAFLPMAHVFEKAWSIYILHRGATNIINHDPRQIQAILKQVRPTAMCAVPRFWEKVYAGVQEVINNATGIKKTLFTQALKVGEEYCINHRDISKRAPFGLRLRYMFYNRMVFSKVKKTLGITKGNLFPCAGAPLSDEIFKFFRSINIPILYGYGSTESTAAASCSEVGNVRVGNVGQVLPGIEVKISDEGEILMKGPNIMAGYYNKPEETAKAFVDGYFRTGDAGSFNQYGDLLMTERIKDLYKTSNGKYIAPQSIETSLITDQLIDQIAVIGDARKFVSALIVPDFAALKAFADNHNIKYSSNEELVRDYRIYRLYEQHIAEHMESFASYERIKRFTLLPAPFSMENGELTNTLKLRRPIVNQHFKAEIEAMYAE